MSELGDNANVQTVAEALVAAVRRAARYNADVESAPHCILWPDRDQQWHGVIPRLQADMPELLVLGDYDPEHRQGPAIWLRCAIERVLDEVMLPEDTPPVLYLPGTGRQDLRAVETCPEPLKPLAELQYRGVTWTQVNGKDWTAPAFLQSDQGGLGLDVSPDRDSRRSLLLALPELVEQEIDLLRGKRLDATYFNTLLSGGDPTRDLLQWLNDPESFQKERSEQEWTAFVEVCRSQFAFNPGDGALVGAAKLAEAHGPWALVWQRFSEAARRYPNIPAQIRRRPMPDFGLFGDAQHAGGWPQWNDQEEKDLRGELLKLAELPAHKAREKVAKLESAHAARRGLVWAELGEAPLACSLQALATLAEVTATSLAAGELEDVKAAYVNAGWRADDAVLKALAPIQDKADLGAVETAIRALYQNWCEDAARHLQKVASQKGAPGGSRTGKPPHYVRENQCVLFVDGLRFDLGKRLATRLYQTGYTVQELPVWAALPSVTATGKPAVAPVPDQVTGASGTTDFEPSAADTGATLSAYHLRRLIKEADWKVLGADEVGDGRGNAWCEFGDIDHEGHDRGWKLARHVDGLLDEVLARIKALLAAGWREVHVVTDHGWLLLPGGLPKIDLPPALADTKWGRCAAIKPGAVSEERLFPWYWNPDQEFALADGISCYKKGTVYAHGGLSLQECLTLQLTVIAESAAAGETVHIANVTWRGLRCKIALEQEGAALTADLRRQAGEPDSSVAMALRPFKDDGTCSLVVEDEDLEGESVVLVLLDSQGRLQQQMDVRIGGEP